MAEIRITIEAYGAVEKHLPTDLNLSCDEHGLVTDVLEQIAHLYPAASDILEKCACAIGDEMVTRNYPLSKDCTLVLLSPVAGG